jgi:hypothetical protein
MGCTSRFLAHECLVLDILGPCDLIEPITSWPFFFYIYLTIAPSCYALDQDFWNRFGVAQSV